MSDQNTAEKGLGVEPWLCDCALSLVGKHKSSCLHDRLERVERLLIEIATPISPAKSTP